MLIILSPNSQFPLSFILDTLKCRCLKKQFGLWTNPIWKKGKMGGRLKIDLCKRPISPVTTPALSIGKCNCLFYSISKGIIIDLIFLTRVRNQNLFTFCQVAMML